MMKKDLDTRFDKDVRLAVFKKINDRIQSIKENEEIGISVREMFYSLIQSNNCAQ